MQEEEKGLKAPSEKSLRIVFRGLWRELPSTHSSPMTVFGELHNLIMESFPNNVITPDGIIQIPLRVPKTRNKT